MDFFIYPPVILFDCNLLHFYYALYIDLLTKNIHSTNKNNITQNQFFFEQLNISDIVFEEVHVTLSLKKIDEQWKIISNNDLRLLVSNSTPMPLEPPNEQETAYIETSLQLLRGEVGMLTGYLGEELGLHNIVIKNHGDQEVDNLYITVSFLNEFGNSVEEKTLHLIGGIDIFNDSTSLKQNYLWEMGNDDYYSISNLWEDININNYEIKISNISFANTLSELNKFDDEKQNYINNKLVLKNAEVSSVTGYSGSEPGLSKVEFKNNGDKAIKSIDVTVYFKNKAGTRVSEETVRVFGSLFSLDDLLKPNYSWKMEDDKYFALENLTSEVDLSDYDIEITNIEFQ